MKDKPSSLRHPVTADFSGLCEALRHAAEQLRGEEPLLDTRRLEPHVEVLRKTLEMFLEAVPAARLAEKSSYASLRPAWLEAWATDGPQMEDAAARALGPDYSEPPADPREALFWRLRLLALMLARCGESTTRELINSVEQRLLATTELGFGIEIDREAHEALRAWSRCDAEEFLSGWKKLDGAMLKRAATVIGVTVPKKWTRPRQEEFHRRARRFARNTMV